LLSDTSTHSTSAALHDLDVALRGAAVLREERGLDTGNLRRALRVPRAGPVFCDVHAGERERGEEGRGVERSSERHDRRSRLPPGRGRYNRRMSSMTPQEIVSELDKNIVGQHDAKRAVAIALRNRWRRQQVPDPLRGEITPKNILMIGPTGVGKTEIARRLARLADAPFVKVEATKFTEVGYVGRDVDTIVRDLIDVAVKQTRESEARKVRDRAADAAEERILDVLLPPVREVNFADMKPADTATRQKFRKMLREGRLDDKDVDIEIAVLPPSMEIMAPPGMEDLTAQLQGMFQQVGGARRKVQRMKVAEAMKVLTDEEAGPPAQRRRDQGEGARRRRAERHRVPRRDRQDRDALRAPGRGRLAPGRAARPPAAGRGDDRVDQVRDGAHRPRAVHRVRRVPPVEALRPDPELQGRFPIRVELSSLTVDDFVQILTATDACLVKQYEALLRTENVELDFRPDAIRRIAEIAFAVNEKQENIGARRLYTVMERLLEEISYAASTHDRETIAIDAAYVDARLAGVAGDDNLAKYIL
jgi:ATP-dependent HslUV protease ATP-binding subunit HslU